MCLNNFKTNKKKKIFSLDIEVIILFENRQAKKLNINDVAKIIAVFS